MSFVYFNNESNTLKPYIYSVGMLVHQMANVVVVVVLVLTPFSNSVIILAIVISSHTYML